MEEREIGRKRLATQHISEHGFDTPREVVAWLGAVQAQDYLAALWAVGLRLPTSSEGEVEWALAEREIVRTWPMRGTLHFVVAEDVRWMLKLLTPRVANRAAARHRQLELDEETFNRSAGVLVKELEGGKQLTRPAAMAVLESGGISTAGQRGIHIVGRLAHDGLICFGPRAGKQQTFVLLDEWIPQSRALDREEALAKLARRYFTGHGPAMVEDLAWWSGLPQGDVKKGVELAGAELEVETFEGKRYYVSRQWPVASQELGVGKGNRGSGGREEEVYLLPAFDELIVGYKDRSAVIDGEGAQKVQPDRLGVFSPAIVADGRVVGTWKRTMKKDAVEVEVTPFAGFREGQQEGLAAAARRYADFLGFNSELVWRKSVRV